MLSVPAALERLLAAVAGAERLVLLGDVAELAPRTARRGLAAAEPVLRALGRRLGPDREVLIVPGNHDARLVSDWVRARGPSLGTDDPVPPEASFALAAMAGWLAPARVQVRYPGVWLAEGVWATHGHYLDRHLVPVSAYGLPRPGEHLDPARPVDYERRLRGRGRRRRVGGEGADPLERALRGLRSALIPRLPGLLLNTRLAPLNAVAIDLQMRRAAVPALARAVARLGLEPEWVLFGHVHRLGPQPGEAPWRPTAPGPRFVNAGSWLWEPLLVDGARPPHPYWPGGAVVLEPGAPPRTVGLLDDLGARELGGPARREALAAPRQPARTRWLSPNSCQR